MRKLKFQRFHNLLKRIIEKYTNLENLKSLGTVVGMLNINAFVSFVTWSLVKNSPEGIWSYLTISVAALWVAGYIFIKSSVYYSGAKWIVWSWISLIFTFPFGVFLMFYTSQNKYWELDVKRINPLESQQNVGKFFKSSLVRLESKWTEAMKSLEALDAKFMQQFPKINLGVQSKGFKNWNEFQISMILAMSLLKKQFKQENFDNFVWQPNWFDDVHFQFAIKNNKILTSKNKYIYSAAAIVLDEINNYHKLFHVQSVIKQNMKFSPAKIILLQWGDQYKIYVNE